MNDGVTDTTETGVPGLDRRERQGGGDRSVDGIAAGIEHRNTGLGCTLGLRNHHPRLPEAAGLVRHQFWVVWESGREVHAGQIIDRISAGSYASPAAP